MAGSSFYIYIILYKTLLPVIRSSPGKREQIVIAKFLTLMISKLREWKAFIARKSGAVRIIQYEFLQEGTRSTNDILQWKEPFWYIYVTNYNARCSPGVFL